MFSAMGSILADVSVKDTKVDWIGVGLVTGVFGFPIWIIRSIYKWFKHGNNDSDIDISEMVDADGLMSKVASVGKIFSSSPLKGGKLQVTLNSDGKGFMFEGRGTQSTKSLELQKGRYRIQYKFPVEDQVEVTLLDASNLENEEETILYECGNGSKTFVVKESGNYVFQIETDEENKAPWRIQCELL